VTQEQAEVNCKKVSGHLVSIHNQAEQDLVGNLVTEANKNGGGDPKKTPGHAFYWLGMKLEWVCPPKPTSTTSTTTTTTTTTTVATTTAEGSKLTPPPPTGPCKIKSSSWIDGTPVDFGNPSTSNGKAPWDVKEPNNFNQNENCVYIYGNKKPNSWNDQNCDNKITSSYSVYGYVCRKQGNNGSQPPIDGGAGNLRCPKDKVVSACSAHCQPSCGNQGPNRICTMNCVPGCVCVKPLIRNEANDQCVAVKDCPKIAPGLIGPSKPK